MAWIYPISASNIQEWYDEPPGFGHAAALAPGDTEFIYTPAGIYENNILLEMGQNCGLCEVRARRGTGIFNTAQLVVVFYDSTFTQSEQWIINLVFSPNWTDFSYTPAFPWRYVSLEGQSTDVPIGVSELRGELISVQYPRRLLTGVGL